MCVGRDEETALGLTLLSRAAAGSGSVLFIVGEPGCGKTALLEAIAAEGKPGIPGLIVAKGEGNAQTRGTDAYLPWKEILLRLIREDQRLGDRGRVAETVSIAAGRSYTKWLPT